MWQPLLKNCGDYDRNGERKAGEFEANDEELDIDPSATAEIYW
nr:hypothetical protein [Salmonella sp.]